MSGQESRESGSSSLHDDIVDYLRQQVNGVAAIELALRFLKIKNANPVMATMMIKNILAPDRRCFVDIDGLWHASPAEKAQQGDRLSALPWTAVHTIIDPTSSGRGLFFFSTWDLAGVPRLRKGVLCIEPARVPCEERETLGIGDDEAAPGVRSIDELTGRVPIFLSAAHRSALFGYYIKNGTMLSDDTILISEFAGALALTIKRPITLSALEEALYGGTRTGESVLALGERFAGCCSELLSLIAAAGIETREELDRAGMSENAHLFAGKLYTYDDMLSLPCRPGVYGFKNNAGEFIYIGKATNLRRRLMSYFSETEESPEKIAALHKQAHSFVTYTCGSELESLVYEYRLIKKYSPLLNSKITVVEQPGEFRPIGDCIIMVPHSEPDKLLSVWFRQDQKIKLVPFVPAAGNPVNLAQELESFFFSTKLQPEPTDFPELELASRWIRKHKDALQVVPVNRMGEGAEVQRAMDHLFEEIMNR